MIKVLSIGNSFSQDAQTYLHQIAANEDIVLYCMNLYIGGCSLERHWDNFQRDAAEYLREENGASTGDYISISQALTSEKWDYVTLQQVSKLSHDFRSYLPYLTELAQQVRKLAPTAKLLIHQTWAYEQGSQRLTEELGYRDQHEMLEDAKNAYRQAAELVCADGIIPSGEAMMYALDGGIPAVHRDTYHAGFGLGRYLLGLTWFFTLTQRNRISGFIPLAEKAEEEDLQLALKAARKAVAAHQKKE